MLCVAYNLLDPKPNQSDMIYCAFRSIVTSRAEGMQGIGQ
jgi:hypothetical protein